MTKPKAIAHSLLQRAVLMLAVCCLWPVASAAQTESAREYTKENPLVYEDAWDLWPYVFLDDQGQPAGYNVDLLHLILGQLNIPYVIHLKPTKDALEDLRSGKADLMLGMVANFHDDYTTYYGKNVIHLFTHSLAHPKDQTPTVHVLDDLKRNEVIVHTGSFSHHLMEDHGWGDNAIPYNDIDKAIQMVSADGKGQVLWNTMSLKWLIHKYHADNLMLSPVDMPSGDYRFMAHDKQLLDMLDAKYAELAASEALKPLQAKWFQPEVKEESSAMPDWFWKVLIAMTASILLLLLVITIYHIRERRATKEGRQRNSRLAHILHASRVKIWTYTARTKTFTWYGDSGQPEKRYTAEEFSRRYTPADYQRLLNAINSIVSGKHKERRVEIDANDGENGECRSYIVNLSVLRTERGAPSIIIGTKKDVTEQHRRQQEVKTLTLRYQGVFNTSMVDMIYYDQDGYIKNMNARSQETFHMNLKETIKNHVKVGQLVNTDQFDYSKFNDQEDSFYSTLFLNAQGRVTNDDEQTVMFYELLVVPVYNEHKKLIGAYGSGRDITEIANTYNKAKESVKQLRVAAEAVKVHVENINLAMQVGGVRMVTYQPKTHMLAINHRMHEAQYVLTQQRCLQLTDLESQRQVMRIFRAMDRRADMSLDCNVKTTLRLPDGKRLCLQIRLYPTRDENGFITRYTGICRDTSEMMHTEMLLKEETEKAQEVEQVKNKFLHNMCYEIRTPLNIVVGFAEMFEKEHSPEEEDVYIQEIKENSAYLLNLINDILFLSRLDAKMVEINVQPTDFSQTFEGHCHMGWAHKQREGVSYSVDNQYSQLVVNIDDANVGRIINQVITNAVEHTETGYVRARYNYIGGKLIIVIEDSGSGINPKTLEHIFERFNGTTGSNQRTGLGMPICKELVTQLGGTIDISSEVGRGTSVWITIPCEAITVEHKADYQ